MSEAIPQFEIREIYPNIIQLTYEKRYDLCMSFLRLQEYYESPEFKGRFFELEEYMDWWQKNTGRGEFNYPNCWSGFNLPGPIVNEWIDKFGFKIDSRDGWEDWARWLNLRSGIRLKEQCLLDAVLKKVKYDLGRLSKCYVIGVSKDDGAESRSKVIAHEVAHAFYTLYPDYKKNCQKLIDEIRNSQGGKKLYENACKALSSLGYHKDVFDDELQALWSTRKTAKSLKKYGMLFVGNQKFIDNYKLFKKQVRKKR